jgi:Matrixin
MPFLRIPPRAVAALGTLGALLWSGHAHAFCREVTGTPPANYDPADAGCFNGVDDAGKPFVPLYWPNQCVSYSLQKNASVRVTLPDARRVARQAFDTWTNAPCVADAGGPSVTEYEYGPTVQCDVAPSNEHNNPIIFRDNGWPYDSANALGFTTLTVDLDTGEIYGAAIEINSSANGIVAEVDGSIPNGFYDLGSILTHEAGHFLGLAHSTDSSAVMYAHYHPGQSVLTPDDVSGICSIYPPDMTRDTAKGKIESALCNATPPLGFLTSCGTVDAAAFITASGPLVLADAGDPPCATSACTMVHGSGPGGAGLAIGGAVVLGVLARRRAARPCAAGRRDRRLTRRTRGAAAAVGITAAFFSLTAREARASVAVAVLFDELVQKAMAVAVVTPVEQRGVVEDGRIVTYTHVRVDRRVAGPIAGDLWVRALGGAVGRIGQIVEGQPLFDLGQPALLFVRPYAGGSHGAPSDSWSVIEAAQGEYPIVKSAGQERLAIAKDVGALVSPARAPVDLRFARDVLGDRPLEEAARQITAAWTRLHAR